MVHPPIHLFILRSCLLRIFFFTIPPFPPFSRTLFFLVLLFLFLFPFSHSRTDVFNLDLFALFGCVSPFSSLYLLHVEDFGHDPEDISWC